MTLQQALERALQAGISRLDARVLLLHVLGRGAKDQAWLIAHDEIELDASLQQPWRELIAQRLDGKPVAYLVGRKSFYSLELQVDSRALDPRSETEILVDWALELLPEGQYASVVDLGTGSGAIALSLAHQRPLVHVLATDASSECLALASTNAQALNLSVEFAQGRWDDWFAPLRKSHKFDLIVSNPPYVADSDPHLAALTHEPQKALIAGPDGLDDLRIIISRAGHYLRSGGWLLLEHGFDQALAVRELLSHSGFQQVQTRLDLAAVERCSGGQWI